MGTLDIHLCSIQKFEPREISVDKDIDLFSEGFLPVENIRGSSEQHQGFRELFKPYFGCWKVPEYDLKSITEVDFNKFFMHTSGPNGVKFVLKSFDRYILHGKEDLLPKQAWRVVPWEKVPRRVRSVEGLMFERLGYQHKGLTRHWTMAYYNAHKDEFNRNIFYKAEDLRKFYYCAPLKLREMLPACIEFPKLWNDGKTFVYINY